jgi:hypothetical protein
MGWVVNPTPRALCPWERDQVLIVQEAGRVPGPVCTVRKISPPPRFDTRTVQPVGSCYTDWAIPHSPKWRQISHLTNSDGAQKLLLVSSEFRNDRGYRGAASTKRPAEHLSSVSQTSRGRKSQVLLSIILVILYRMKNIRRTQQY